MNKNLLNVKNLSFSNQNNDSLGAITQIAKKDIAIIGICGQFGNAVDHKEFWNSIRSGKDLIREFPESRKKHIDQYYSNKGAKDEHQKEYFIGAYLDNIDEFDYSHFSLSPKEADLMDPHQRLFLQTAWKAIEDAGYGGNKIKGSKTGIFVGYSADFGEDYREIIRTNDPDSLELSVVPNLRSIIASRIAYVLDLTGPSLVVDTACSSSLMAVHLACKSIRQNECEMAIAGSIRLLLMPTKKDKEYRIGLEKILGVESDSGRARTFDETSDGTGLGEGMGALILKPLSKAIEDKDYIYAVIKGSAANQDGNSVGITAPNSEAQAKVIIQAWKDAGINPETVSYIEAHGTGTNLGDPIEINGLQRAFRKFTNKKQFCGIGSLKTNIGHLDNASGIASMIKVSMSLVNREIAPSLNFNYPNKKINFVGSPIYVNDSLREWQVSGHPRRCGVSAFGLSGTNCHIILEEAPEIQDRKSPQTTEDRIMTISASSAEALVLLIAEYRKFLTSNPDIDMEALCYTAATGRGHYAYRISLIVSDQRDLLKRLELIKNIDDLMSCKELYYKEHRVVSTSDLVLSEVEITEDHKSSLTLDAQNIIQETDWNNIDRYEVLDKICRLYINGASIDWEEYYTKQGKKINKIPIPTYQFSKKRCWVKTVRRASRQLTANKKEIERPLVDRMLINLNDFSVYETVFNVEKDWVLNEHKILGQYLVPGTTYIEMIREIIDNSYNYNKFQLSGVTFMSPMIVAHGENREVNTILRKNNNLIEFTVSSRSSLSEASTIHAVGNINFSSPVIEGGSISINELKGRMIEENINTIIQEESDRTDIEVGGRWDCARRIFKGDNEYLAFIELPSVYEKDLDSFIIHPSLMDCGVNVLNTIISSELYLPFTYKNIKYYNPLQKSFWCYLKRSQKGSAETISFDIKFISNDEKLLMDIEEYTIKKVNTMDFNSEKSDDDNYFKLEWKESTIEKKASFPSKGSVLFFKGQNSIANEIAASLKKEGFRIIEVREGGAFEKVDDDRYTIGASCDDLESLLEHINENTFNYIVHSYALSQSDENISLELLNTEFNSSLLSLFNLTKVLINHNIKVINNTVLLTDYAYDIESKNESKKLINPLHAALMGLASVVSNEYVNLKLKCIDIDKYAQSDALINEFIAQDEMYCVSYRNNIRYVREINQVELNQFEESRVEIKHDGVYIVTGGTGALGLSVSKYLSNKNRVKICLINRSKFPPREEWDTILKTDDKLNKNTKKLASKISDILEIEKNGSEVCLLNSDISDAKSLKSAIDTIKSRYGGINGVIHAAGVAGQGFIFNKDEKAFKDVLAPKIYGTWILDSLTRDENPDFLILFSSISSFMAEMGQGDYAAANAYLDAYAEYRTLMGYKTVAINWPAWRETGMAVEFDVNFDKEIFNPINTKDALFRMEQILDRNIESIVPTKINYKNFDEIGYKLPFAISKKLQQNIKKYKSNISGNSIESNSISNVVIKGKAEDKITQTERKLAKLWSKILGVEELNVNDKFQSLGGDSILSTELLKLMDSEFSGMVDIADIFTYSTIASMAAYIEGLIKDKEEITQSDSKSLTMEEVFILLERGEISPEEADKLITAL